MDRDGVQAWLDRYVAAWRTYDAQKIGELFSEDALYIYSPFEEHDPVRGREAIVANWLEEPDDPATWQAAYWPLAVDGNMAVAQGRTRYVRDNGGAERVYANLFVLHFDEQGRCARFLEWYMQAPSPIAAPPSDTVQAEP